MPELLPDQASEPAREQEAVALQRLRLSSALLGVAAAVVSAVVTWLAIPPVDAGPLAFISLVPLMLAVRGARARRSAVLGLVFGVVYFGILMSWLIPISTLGWSVLAIGQGAWMALAFAGIAATWREEHPIRTALFVGAIWTAVEWGRGVLPLGGFSWGGLGYTQHDNPLLLPLASVAGVWGISFVLATINALLASLLTGRVASRIAGSVASRPGSGGGAVARLAAALGLALAPALIPTGAPAGPAVDVAVVQGNVPTDIAFADRVIEDRVVAENHAALHRELAVDPPDLAVWPENALDLDPTRDAQLGALVRGAIRSVGAPTVVGAITRGDDGELRNENLLYTGDGALADRYVKNHLVPFGEYVPFRGLLEGRIEAIEQIRADLTPGDEPGRFRIPAGTFSSVICFENAFPDLVRRYTGASQGFILVSTNNATFRRSPAAEQHLAMSELRAVENARWVVHAAITGISGIVDPTGAVISRTELFEPAIIRASIPSGEGRTIFNVIGGWLPGLFVLGAVLGLIRPRRRDAREAEHLQAGSVRVIIPTYEEADSIAEAIEGVLAVDRRIRVLVVDDSSPDGTADVVRTIGNDRVELRVREGKQGLASAYRAGFEHALAAGDDLIVEMDGDLSHRPADLRGLLEGSRRHDLVIGSRYVRGGRIPDWGLGRRMLSRGGNLYARVLLGLPVADSTSGFRVFRRALAERLLHREKWSDGYAFQIELAYRAWREGFSVEERPITFDERRAGWSKISRGIVLEALRAIPWWALRDRVFRRP